MNCPIKLDKIHCQNCYFNPTNKKCDFIKVTREMRKK